MYEADARPLSEAGGRAIEDVGPLRGGRPTRSEGAPGEALVIEVGRGRRVVVDGAVDAKALARVLDVLDRR